MSSLQRFVIFGDPHGDEIDPVVEAAFFSFLDDFKPDIVVNGGDNWNFAYLRRNASDKERAANAEADWQMGSEFFLRVMAYGKQRFFLRGNHDERVYDAYKNATREDSRIAAEKGIKDIEKLVARRRVKMLPYNSRIGVLDHEGIRVVHGYAHGVGGARQHAVSYGTCVYCHTHATDVGSVERWPEPSIAFGTGCLTRIDQDYNKTQRNKLRHENAWVLGYTDGSKASYFQVRRGAGGLFHAPIEIKAY